MLARMMPTPPQEPLFTRVGGQCQRWGRAFNRWRLRPALRRALDALYAPAWRNATLLRLLARGADPNGRSSRGEPLLQTVIAEDDCKFARLLMALGADPAMGTVTRACPFQMAWHVVRSPEMADVLLDSGLNLHPPKEGAGSYWLFPAAVFAAKGWCSALLRVLDQDQKAWHPHLLTHLAMMNTLRPDVLEVALAHGADPNGGDGIPVLHWATWWGNAEVVRILLAAGANPLQRSETNQTVLEGVAALSKEAVVLCPEENQAIPLVQAAILDATLVSAPAPAEARRRL